MLKLLMAAVMGLAGPAAAETCDVQTLSGEPPLIIAHRGASGERPEHTIEAYRLAIEQGADVIEPDLIMTRDRVLIARHDLFLSTTTDIAARPEFADRKRRKLNGGKLRHDWWTEDFTLAEIKTLRAVQPRPERGTAYDGLYEIPTFEEVIALAKEKGVAIYPETKDPIAHAKAGLDMEAALIAALQTADWTGAEAPVFVQSFEPGILEALNGKIDTPLVQLVIALPGFRGPRPNIALDKIAAYADGVGPSKALLVHKDGQTTDFVAQAHGLGLYVHPWTYRDDQPPGDGADIAAELKRAFAAGVDGVFADFPQTAVQQRSEWCSTGKTSM